MTAPSARTEQRYAQAEQLAEQRRRARLRRQPLLLLGLLQVLVVGVAATAVVDLRRLATPEGTALRWAQAAVFGDCADYRAFSVADTSVPDSRSPEQLCHDLRAATAQARQEVLEVGLAVGTVVRRGRGAEVHLVLTRSRVRTPLTLRLSRVDGRWRVVRDALTCGSVGCA